MMKNIIKDYVNINKTILSEKKTENIYNESINELLNELNNVIKTYFEIINKDN